MAGSVWIELNATLQFPPCSLPIPFIKQFYYAEGDMRLGKLIVKLNRL